MKKGIVLLMLLVYLFSCSKTVTEYIPDSACNCLPSPVATDKYIYPILPGTTQWDSVGRSGGLTAIYKVCQVPDALLNNMSTLGLIQSLETNPTLTNMLLYVNKFQGRDFVLPNLNVNQAFTGRSDAGSVLISYYNQRYPCCADTITNDLAKGRYAFQWDFFDMVCTQNTLLNSLSFSQKKEFGKIVINKFYTQLKYPDIFGSNRTSSCMVLSSLMRSSNYRPYVEAMENNANLTSYANSGILNSDQNYEDVLYHAKRFVNN